MPDVKGRRSGYVSVWAGCFPDETSFRAYLQEATEDFNLNDGEEDFCPLWDDLGFSLPHESVRACFCRPPVSLAELVARMPHVETFRESLLNACKKMPLDKVTAVLAIYGLDYAGKKTLAFGQLPFIGSFRFA